MTARHNHNQTNANLEQNKGQAEKIMAPDESQAKVIKAHGGCHLVLAPPGCGKTQILMQRVAQAHKQGMEYADMVCLTFTNRAARGMSERIQANINDEGIEQLYVGNVHRFCSKFLFSNSIIPAETSVIDEDDAVSILARYLDEDEYAVSASYKRRREYAEVFHFANFMRQIRLRHPKNLRIHPECVSGSDVAAMRKICQVQGMKFDAAAMIDIYDHADFYKTACTAEAYDYGDRQNILSLLRKMEQAKHYESYKKENRLLDFQDLLISTYDAISNDKENKFKRYPWIQVDEVQDLNALQIAIIDGFTAKKFDTVMFLGDEQQAIFSFMGAKADTLNLLKSRCEGNIHHLSVNHRSPKYLLDVFNKYASDVLHIDQSLLPTTSYEPPRIGNELRILRSDDYESEVRDVVQFAGMLAKHFEGQTTAVVVNANTDAEDVSKEMERQGLSHFKVSGNDLFASPEVKLLLAHLNALANSCNFMAWARLLKGLKVFDSNAAARTFVRSSLDRAIMPSDFIFYGNGGTYVQDFVKTYEQEELVVFDTETTGLDVFNDDILQIAAVKMRCGKVVEGSEFSVFITTEREIPKFLGDIENPIIEERKRHKLYGHAEALKMFLDYVGNDPLLGHNADYDYNILSNNLARYCHGTSLKAACPRYFDSLKLTRLLEPELKEYKLKYLLAVLNLEGSNSHLADDDVNATCSVVRHCYEKGKAVAGMQQEFMSDERVKKCISILKRNYSDIYKRAAERLYSIGNCFEGPAMVDEIMEFYNYLVAERMIEEIGGIHYIVDFLSHDILNEKEEPSLSQQLSAHIMEINTLKEADLCNSRAIKERVFVTTIHKAKGLEFDNVIVFDAVDGRCPNFYSQNNASLLAEDARKFYVAITRAKRRLYVSQSMFKVDFHNRKHERQLTRFMDPIAEMFE